MKTLTVLKTKVAGLCWLALLLCAKPTFAVDLMVNGGFEDSATSLAPWVTQYGGCTDSGNSYFPLRVMTGGSNGSGIPGVPTISPFAGTRYAEGPFTCGPQLANGVYYPANTGFMLLYQDVAIPANASITLSWSDYIYSNLAFYAAPDWRSARPQFYRVEIRNTSNTVLQTVFSLTAPANTATHVPWANHTVPLGATYGGQTIRVAFVYTTETGLTGPGNTGLDRVQLDSLGPTGAMVTVGGYVLTHEGRAPRGALVTLSDLSGNTRKTYVNRLGHYQFEEVEPGQTYFVSAVAARGYTFTPPTHAITPISNLAEVNFTALVSSP